MGVHIAAALSDPMEGDKWTKPMLIGSLLVLLTPLIVPVLAVNGYIVRLHQRKAAGHGGLPAFGDWGQLTVDGLKVMVIGFVYALIPLIVFLITVGGSVGELTTGPVAGRVAAFAGGFGGLAFVVVLGVVFAYLGVAGVINFSHSGDIWHGFDVGAIKQLVTSGDYAVAWLAAGPLNLAYTVTGGWIIVSTGGLAVLPVVFIKFYVLVLVGNLLAQAYTSVTGPQPNRPSNTDDSGEDWQPVTWSEAFRFPIENTARRRDVFIGGTVLFVPPVGWILNLGHRLDVVYRLAEGSPPYFRGFKPWMQTFKRGLRAFFAIVAYLSPSGIFGVAALWRWYVGGGDTVTWGLAAVSALLFVLAIFTLPGGMTINAARRDMSYLYRPDKAFRRAMEGGRRYLKSWAIALSAISLSFVGLGAFGVGYQYTSVWAWSVVGYAFSRALVLPKPAKNDDQPT